MAKGNKAFEFGPFRLEVRERRLTRDGHSVPLRGRVFDTLYALVSRHGCLITKDELMAIVWPDSVVEESNLNHNICVLRRSLGEKATGQRYVETVPRQGYRFVAPVRELDNFETTDLADAWGFHQDMPPDSEPRKNSTLTREGTRLRAGNSATKPERLGIIHTLRYRYQAFISSLALALMLVVGYFGVQHVGFVETRSRSRIMVAVLPFDNLTGNPSQMFIADGLSHEIISQLGKWNTARVGVIAYTTSKVYKNLQKSISEIGSELGVSYVVEGSLRRDENSYRVTVMLIRVEDQAHLWAANYAREVKSVTALQEEIGNLVAHEIGRRIDAQQDGGSPSAYSKGPENLPCDLILSDAGTNCLFADCSTARMAE